MISRANRNRIYVALREYTYIFVPNVSCSTLKMLHLSGSKSCLLRETRTKTSTSAGEIQPRAEEIRSRAALRDTKTANQQYVRLLHGGKGERQSSASKQNQEQKTPSPTSTSFYKEGGGTFTIRYEHALLQVQAVKVYQASSYRLRVT